MRWDKECVTVSVTRISQIWETGIKMAMAESSNGMQQSVPRLQKSTSASCDNMPSTPSYFIDNNIPQQKQERRCQMYWHSKHRCRGRDQHQCTKGNNKLIKQLHGKQFLKKTCGALVPQKIWVCCWCCCCRMVVGLLEYWAPLAAGFVTFTLVKWVWPTV